MTRQAIEITDTKYLPRPGSEERADEQAAVRDLANRLIGAAADLDAPAAAERLTNANFGTLEACRFFAAALVRKGWISDDLAARVEMTREVASRVAPVAATLLDVAEAYHRIMAAEACARARVEADRATAAARKQPHTTPAPRKVETFTLPQAIETFAEQLVAEGLSPDMPTARRELRNEVYSRAACPILSDVVAAFCRMTASLRPMTPADLLFALKHRGQATTAAA